MSAIVCGIDPGLSGAIAFLFADGAPLIFDMPIRHDRREISSADLACMLAAYTPGLVITEDLHGPASFKLGAAFGAMIVTVLSLRFRLERVAPRTWQAEYKVGSKPESIKRALSLYPNAPLVPPGKRAPKHDRADSLLIARYGFDHYVRP